MHVDRRIVCLILWLVSFQWACTSDVKYNQLTLRITSDSPTPGDGLDGIRILFRSNGVNYPENPNDERFNLSVSETNDPTQVPLQVAIDSGGGTFSDQTAWIQVSGLKNGKIQTHYEGEIKLDEPGLVSIHLAAIPEGCDSDGDLFLDCTQPGCCGLSDSGFADCHPTEPSAHPWATEATCEPCSDAIDQNCDGVDEPCIDEDNDGVADCEELTCGLNDPTVGPNLPELCDGRDNDCDGSIDEGFFLSEKGENLAVGEACGLGTCEGVVICGSESTTVCEYLIGPLEEVCGDGLDNDCDGATDNGCDKVDMDGDGVSVEEDCNDLDSAFFPGAQEVCCPAFLDGNPDSNALCDMDCDGEVVFCDPEDVDGDGFWGPDDCDPHDSTVYVGANEKCGDGIDQDCFGGDLPCDGLVDDDGDQWPASVDCNDKDPLVHPGATEVCDDVDNDCDGLIDEGNPGNNNGDPCTVKKQIGECVIGKAVCDHSGPTPEVICYGEVAPQEESCDGLDNNCDGETDEGFAYDGAAIGEACMGLGQCGQGTAECHADGTKTTCSSMPDGSESQASNEVCDAIDNDCDGELNEDLTDVSDSTCLQAGICGLPGAVVSALCKQDDTGTWECDYGGVPGYQAGEETLCDGLDNNCDGNTDESFSVNLGCDGDDADSCANGVIVCGEDGLFAVCNEGPGKATESCDGLDNDCDGLVDEDFPELGDPCDGPDSDSCMNGTYTCSVDGTGLACIELLNDVVELCDGIDNDCDGIIDEDFPTLGQDCDGDDQDQCANGTFTCNQSFDSVWCVNESMSINSDECNGQDDDCDGLIDEDSGTQSCGIGQCEKKVELCLDGVPQACLPMEGATPEVCDGVDNDCDGETDEELGSIACGVGECVQVLDACADGAEQVCNPFEGAVEEICDGLDNDCDGVVDDGCPGSSCPEGFGINNEGLCESDAYAGMIYVPAGEFTMGCPIVFDDDAPDKTSGACNLAGLKNASPAHTVVLDAFAIEKTEVTVNAYVDCVGMGICSMPTINDVSPCKSDKETWNGGAGGEMPVNFVSYHQAKTYCEWRGARLCTEAEWERAARGDATSLYPWGYDGPTCDISNFKGCGNVAVEVGSFPEGASPYGLLDMAGNLSEWTSDYFAANYYDSSPELNPLGPDAGDKNVARGGHMNSSLYDIRSYRRYAYVPTDACHFLGFRCCQDVPQN